MQAWVKSDTSHQVKVEIASDFGFYWQDKQLSAISKQSHKVGSISYVSVQAFLFFVKA